MAEERSHPASRGAVLDAIRVRGTASRAELAQVTRLTQATISNVVKGLLDEGLVVETGERVRTGGKPRVMLTLNASALCALGVQLAADAIVLVLVDALGALLARTRLPGARDLDPPQVLDRIADGVIDLLVSAGIPPANVAGIGVASPGLLDDEGGVILTSNSLPAWDGYPLRAELSGRTGFPVHVGRDAMASALGEFWGGQGTHAMAHCTVQMGASLSTGIVVNGTLLRGASGNTGAFGRLPIPLATDDGAPVTFEEWLTPPAIAARARAAVAAGAATTMTLSPENDWFRDYTALATAAVRGDELALTLLREAARELAEAVLFLANVLDLDSVVLAGPAFAIAGTIFLVEVRDLLHSHFFARSRHPVRVRLAEQVMDSAAVGAGALVLQAAMTPR